MTLFALTKSQEAGGEIALAVALAIAGFYLLLPRPRGRLVVGGVAALIAALAVLAAWAYRTFGHPASDAVGAALFWLFSLGALVFGAVLVAQRNPARGAIAFAFVILSTCGLFLLLAAPFLMAATIIIYAGAIIVTFLFLLMLSHSEGPSDENDRSREPLYGSFAGFAFTGLVLFALFLTSQGAPPEANAAPAGRLPVTVMTAEERAKLADAVAKLDAAEKALDGATGTHEARDQRVKEFEAAFAPARDDLESVVGSGREARDDEGTGSLQGGTLRERLEKTAGRAGGEAVLYRSDPQARDALARARRVREASRGVVPRVENNLLGDSPDVPAAQAEVRKLRDEVVLLHGAGQLPARNVANLGYLLYSEHLLGIELAGTLLLVAVIGAIAVAHRRREGARGEPAGGSPARTEVAK
jgi:NADH:ubiquinone oxidoreductase subunit 6 (subunit J)